MKYELINPDADVALPTLRAFIKSIADEEAVLTHLVKRIWAPNLYDNYTLETEAYKFRLPKGHPYYSLVRDHIDSWMECDSVLALQIDMGNNQSVCLMTMDEEKCKWEIFGDTGYRLGAVEARKSASVPKNLREKRGKQPDLPSAPLEGPSD